MSAKKKNDESKKKLSKKQMKKLEKMRASKRDDAAMRKAEKKREKGRRPAGAASFKLDLGTCPCCSKRCPLSKPKCGKGRAVARKKRERLMGEAVA